MQINPFISLSLIPKYHFFILTFLSQRKRSRKNKLDTLHFEFSKKKPSNRPSRFEKLQDPGSRRKEEKKRTKREINWRTVGTVKIRLVKGYGHRCVFQFIPDTYIYTSETFHEERGEEYEKKEEEEEGEVRTKRSINRFPRRVYR